MNIKGFKAKDGTVYKYDYDALANKPEIPEGPGSGGNADQTSVEPAYDDIPKIFFSTPLQQTKDEIICKMWYLSKTLSFSCYVKIKAQGNSSMSYAKKNQTAKLYTDEACTQKLKINFKGWGAQHKFVLKANWIDLSHARNVVSARLWADVVKSRANYADLPELLKTTPNQGAVDGFPVKVYAAGVYQGRYTLNIPKDKWTFNMDDKLDEHCVLCGENYASGCFRALAQINESDWTDEIHDVVPASIKTRWNQVISFVVNSTDEEFRANLSQYFYVDSLIDYYLFALASCGLDALGKNQIYATYDGQRWIASMYDMDSTWGLYWNGSKFVATDYARNSYEDMVSGRQGNLLYIRLEQLFSTELQTRWAELKIGALSIENIINRFERFTDISPAELVAEDYASTTGGGKFTGIPSQTTNNIQQIRAFALARQAWTDTYVAGLAPVIPVPCTGITLDKSALIFTEVGTQTIVATVMPNDTTDKIVWSSNNPNVATVENGVVTAVENGDATITVTCGNYSANCTVSVSGIAEAGLMYSLPGETMFDGAESYVDTGVQLIKEDIDFTIAFHAKAGTGNTNNDSIFHCMYEEKPYPGYGFGVNHSNSKYRAYVGSCAYFAEIQQDNNEFKVVMTHERGVAGLNVKVLYNGNVTTLVKSGTPSVYSGYDTSLLLGCYQDTNGNKGRFWAGTLYDFKVYNKVLSDDRVSEYLT